MRMIDADKINYYKATVARWMHSFDGIEIAEKFQIDRMPTIDPESLRPRGKWEITDTPIENAVCTNCGSRFHGYYESYQYCPRCGAKMEGGHNP